MPKRKRNEATSSDNEASDQEMDVDQAEADETQVVVDVGQLSKSLKEKPRLKKLKRLVILLERAVKDAEEKPDTALTRLNQTVTACLLSVGPALTALVKVKEDRPVQEASNWQRMKGITKKYATSILQVLSPNSSDDVTRVLLKHIHQIVPYIAAFKKLPIALIKKLVDIWSTGSESNRVLAFLCINKLTRLRQKDLLDHVLKRMYLAYVRNCKFTSPTTLPLIQFMQKSLVELFAIDINSTYQHAFVYIRQLAIHLRNAITILKKETTQAVYNGQFVHSLSLWTQVVCGLHNNNNIRSLIYPLTQVTIGTCKLVPTERYYPLRFACVRLLIQLGSATKTYIPVLPFLTEVFELTDFNRKHKTATLKPFNMRLMLKLSKLQLTDKAFKDSVIDTLFDLLLEALACHSHSIAFPELVFPLILQLKQFLKTCKLPNLCKPMKLLLTKIEQNVESISKKRRAATFTLTDKKQVETFEHQCRVDGTPMSKFLEAHRKRKEKQEEMLQNVLTADNVEVMEMSNRKKKKKLKAGLVSKKVKKSKHVK